MKKHLIAFAALLLLLSAVLTGCADGTGKDQKEEEPTTLAGQSQTAGEPIEGGSVVVGIQQDMDSLDPHKAVAAGTKEVLFNIYEGLVKPDENGNLIPAVASDYQISEDGTEYVFQIREGVTFHNGDPVRPEDVVYSLKRCAGLLDNTDSSVVVEKALSSIQEISAEGNEVKIVLSQPDTELLGYLTLAVIPEGKENCDKDPIGTGPFVFQSYKPLEELVVTKNEAYWGEEKAHLDQVTFKIVANTDTAAMELKSGAIDIYAYLTYDQAAQLEGTFRIEEGNMGLVQGLFLNNDSELFSDPNVRRALNYAVDRQGVLDMVANGKGNAIATDMFRSFQTCYNEETEQVYSYDPAKAKELLAGAGYADGITFDVIVPSNYQYHVDSLQVIAEQVKESGIQMNIKLVDEAVWLSQVYTDRNYDATLYGLAAKVVVPGRVLQRYASDASNNFINFSNADYDRILKEAQKSTDEGEKASFYKELQKILTEEAASVYLQDPALLVAVNPKLEGYQFYPIFVQDMASLYYTE